MLSKKDLQTYYHQLITQFSSSAIQRCGTTPATPSLPYTLVGRLVYFSLLWLLLMFMCMEFHLYKNMEEKPVGFVLPG